MLASASGDRTVRVRNATAGQEVQKLEHIGYSRQLTFMLDGTALLTDRGRISTNTTGAPAKVPRSHYSHGLGLNQDSIQCHDEKLVH